MPTAWTGSGTRRDRHGFDYLIAVTPNMGSGVACGWLDVQISSFINRDLDRQQIIVVHESAHLFGSPQCDDVGNGSGGNLQGYVMCAEARPLSVPPASRDRGAKHIRSRLGGSYSLAACRPRVSVGR